MAELSPAAQAVLDAYNAGFHHPVAVHCKPRIAAALRTAAVEVVPVPIDAKTPEEHWALLGVKNRLLAIADELENV